MSQVPLRKARAIRRDLVPSHLQTQASQENRAIERSLLTDLNQYVNLIRAELDKTKTHQWTSLRAMIIPRLRDSVSQTIRGHIGDSYQLGAQYITDRVGLQNASFLTHSDIDNVKTLTQEFTDKFFGRIQLSLNNTLNKTFPFREPDSKINPNYIVTSIAISAASKAFSEGKMMKAKSLLQTNQNVQAILSAAEKKKSKQKKKKPVPVAVPLIDELEDEDLFPIGVGFGLGFAGGISLASLAADQLSQQEFIWVCAESPCPICQDLEGQVWSMDEIDLAPRPTEDTHPSCRCTFLLL